MVFPIHRDFKLTHGGKRLSITEIGEIFPEVAEFLSEWNSSNDWIELQTSGSTGKPKVLRVLKSIAWHSAGATLKALDLPSPTKALLALPTRYIAGKMMLIRAMRGGWCLEVQSASSDVLNGLQDEFDFAALVPMQVESALDDLHRVRCLLIGGAPVSLPLRNELARSENRIYESYGMTETLSHVALKRIAPVSDDYFTALPGVKFSTDSHHCLVIRAPEWGYDELVTTDVVDLLDEKRFVWKGRADFVINSGGVKVHPERLEEQLKMIWNREVYVIGIPDTRLGSKVVAVVEKGEPLKPIDTHQIHSYEIPKIIMEIHSFPRTGSGKIDRRALIQWATNQ